MKQPNASSFATLRVSTVLAMLWALPVGPASAIPIQLTSGHLEALSDIDFILNLAAWALQGPGFLHATDGQFEYFMSPGAFPECPVPPCPVSPTVNLSFSSFVSGPVVPGAPFDVLIYGGQEYVATGGQVNVTTPSAVLPARAGGDLELVTLPFTLHGDVSGDSPTAGSVGLEFVGRGTVRALYLNRCFPAPECDVTHWALFQIRYDIEPIPEPTTWLLLGSGLLGAVARRRSMRMNK